MATPMRILLWLSLFVSFLVAEKQCEQCMSGGKGKRCGTTGKVRTTSTDKSDPSSIPSGKENLSSWPEPLKNPRSQKIQDRCPLTQLGNNQWKPWMPETDYDGKKIPNWWRTSYHPGTPRTGGEDIPPVIYKTCEMDAPPKKIQWLYDDIMKKNPGWRVEYFSAARRVKFIKEHFSKDWPEVVTAYDDLLPGAYKADLWRLTVLYIHGGVYGDFSQQYVAKLDELIDRKRDSLVVPLDLLPRPPHEPKSGVNNSFLAATPKHPYIRECIRQIVENAKNRFYGVSDLDITGPQLLRKVLNEMKHKINYRMFLFMWWENTVCPIAFYRMTDGKLMIIHKYWDQSEHYKLMKVTKKQDYRVMWAKRQVYRNRTRTRTNSTVEVPPARKVVS